MSQNHQKLDAKTISNCIILLVKDSPTIIVSMLITDIQARFKYKVSCRKAWWAKQMVMQQLYGDFDVSYNELQWWVVAMREYVSRMVTDLAFPHYKSMVQVDGTWLYDRYTQILLIVVAQDDNRNARQHLPNLGWIEWAICCCKAFGVFAENREDSSKGSRCLKLKCHHHSKIGVSVSGWVVWRTGSRVKVIMMGFSMIGHINVNDGDKTTYTRANLDVEQLIDEVYTLQHTLHIWGNEFPIMSDVSNLEVSPIAFELLSNRSLRRHPKGRPQSMRIRNDMMSERRANLNSAQLEDDE
ncbi:hypothetical protein GOBAR_DD14641 [Gossypium barbadense]|nr:hypothetical protein GOBAR_DD14641 [Gossypium barbadense]